MPRFPAFVMAGLVITTCISTYGQESSWTGSAGALFMGRSDPSSVPLLLSGAGATKFNAQQMDFNVATGLEIRVSRQIECGRVELRYFQIDGWNAVGNSPFLATDQIGFVPLAGGIGAPGVVTFQNKSELHSGEINIWRPVHECLSVSAGFRWTELDDRLEQAFVLPGLGVADARTDALNHLYGFQVGADALLWTGEKFEISGIVKAGIYGNSADQRTTFSEPPIFEAGAIRDKGTAFLGELGVKGKWQLKSCINLVAEYRLMWIDGVALAPDQIPHTSPPAPVVPRRLDRSTVFYSGAVIGLEITH